MKLTEDELTVARKGGKICQKLLAALAAAESERDTALELAEARGASWQTAADKLKIVPLVWPTPLGLLTVEQDGAAVLTKEFDRVALDTNLAPRAADLRFRTLHLGAELWPELLRDLDLGPKIRPDLDGVRRKG